MEYALATYPPMSAARNAKINETVKKERNRLFAFIKKRVSNEADAEDILQDVFYQYVANLELADTIERTASWLFTVAGNKIIDWYRKKKPVSLDEQKTRQPEDDEGSDLYLGIEDIIPDGEGDAADEFTNNVVWQELDSA